MESLVSHWWVFLAVLASCVGYIWWKAKGGNLLFRDNPRADGTTRMFTALAAFFFSYGAVMVAMIVAAIAALLLVVAAVGALFI
jgi:hypothetical protein